MTKLGALKKTRDRWMRLKPERRSSYNFGFNQCALCRCYNGLCFNCPWCQAYSYCYSFNHSEFNWIRLFKKAKTNAEAEMWRDAVVGMLEYLIEETNHDLQNNSNLFKKDLTNRDS